MSEKEEDPQAPAPEQQQQQRRQEPVKFDYQNLVVYHNAAADSIELLVTVPFSDGVPAEAKITLSSPVRIVAEGGEQPAEYRMNINSALATGAAPKQGEADTQTSDGLLWEIPQGYPGGWTSLLEHEPRVKEFLMSQFRPGGFFVDVGANVGAYSLRAASRGMRVVAFEPNPDNANLLKKNAKLNNLSIELHECALGTAEGVVAISPAGAASRVALGSVEGTIQVPLSSLDSFNLSEVTLMKVDVEGYELEVIEGARQTLERCRPNMMIEMHHWLGAEKEAALFKILSDLGYRFEYLDRYTQGRHLAAISESSFHQDFEAWLNERGLNPYPEQF